MIWIPLIGAIGWATGAHKRAAKKQVRRRAQRTTSVKQRRRQTMYEPFASPKRVVRKTERMF